MTPGSTFSDYATRLRGLIHDWERAISNAAGGIESSPAHVGDCEFNQLALELFALQYAHNEPYRRFCQARGAAPETITDWANIPAIPTSAFKDLELTSLSPPDRTVVFHSSGTTEQRPSHHFHSAESLAVYEASLLPWFAVHVLTHPPVGPEEQSDERSPSPRPSPPGETTPNFYRALRPPTHPQPLPRGERPSEFRSPLGRGQGWVHRRQVLGQGASSSAQAKFKSSFRILSLTPSPAESPHSSLAHMFETVRRTFGSPNSAFLGHVASDGTWALDVDSAIASLGCSRRRKEAKLCDSPLRPPVVLLGTAFLFVHLLDVLGQKSLRLKLPPGSRVVETGGYKGRSRELPKAELHALISERLGISASHIVCEFGMSELSSQAYGHVVGEPTPYLSQEGNNSRTRTSMLPSRRGARSGFCFPPWARAQIISPETGREVGEGETGLIRAFDLANVWSVMAIQTEDLGVRRGEGFELIGRAKTAEPRGCSLMTP